MYQLVERLKAIRVSQRAKSLLSLALLMGTLLLMCLLLSGCGPVVKSGNVVDKAFSPAHDDTNWVQIGDTGYWDTDHYPDRWFVTIKAKCEDDKYHTTQYQVDKSTYDRLKIGDWYEAQK